MTHQLTKHIGVEASFLWPHVHDQVIALRAVETSDFMTADWYPFDGEFLKRVSRRIVNEVNGVCRVVYDSKLFLSAMMLRSIANVD